MSAPRGPAGWEAGLEAKNGLPLDQMPGKVHVLHLRSRR
jgi:hypothetical protein